MAKSAEWDGNRSVAVELIKLRQTCNNSNNKMNIKIADVTEIKGLMGYMYLGYILINLGKCKEEL
jgi:hypothetical protein